jgi:hypothetical protein
MSQKNFISFQNLQKGILATLFICSLLTGVFGLFSLYNENKTISQAATALSIYISPSGNDITGDGSINNPYQTIEKGRDVARVQLGVISGDVAIILRGGTYEIESPIQLDEYDSGRGANKVVYQAYAGETPVLDGGIVTPNTWQMHDTSNNIYRVQVGTLPQYPRTLVVDNVPAVRARSQDNPPWITRTNNEIVFTGIANWLNTTANPTEVETVWQWAWSQQRCLADSITANKININTECSARLTALFGANDDNAVGTSSPTRNELNWVENAYELLDQPNEWYYNKNDGYLYYKPVGTTNPSSQTFALSQTQQAFVLKGKSQSPIKNIEIQGLTIQNFEWNDIYRTNSTFSPGFRGYLGGQAGSNNQIDIEKVDVQTAAIDVYYGQGITLSSNTVRNVGSAGIRFHQGAKSNTIVGNTLLDLGGSGITLGGYLRSPSDSERTENNIIYNNTVQRYGRIYDDSVGIFQIYGNNSLIKHNLVADSSYGGIHIGWGFREMDNTQTHDNEISYNRIVNVMQKYHDGAAIYTNGIEPGSKIQYNYIENNPNDFGAIYQDDGSSFRTVRKNVIKSNPQNWYILWNDTMRYNTVEDNYTDTNNIIYNPGAGAGNILQNNQYFTSDTQFPEINTIKNASGLCSSFDPNLGYNTCDIPDTYCINGAINAPTCTDNLPTGSFDKIENNRVYGWAKDPNSNAPITVSAYIGTVTPVSTTTNYVRPLGDFVCNFARNDANNGFGCEIPIPNTFQSGRYDVFLFAKNPTSNHTSYFENQNPSILVEGKRGSSLRVGDFNCAPNPTTPSSAMDCRALLNGKGTFYIDSNGIYAGMLNVDNDYGTYLGNSSACTIENNSTPLATLLCANVPVPSNTNVGDRQIGAFRPNVEGIPDNDPSTQRITVLAAAPTAITAALLDTSISCTPSSVTVFGMVNCIGQMPANTYPQNITAKAGVGGVPVDCDFANGQINCEDILVGAQAGNIQILISLQGNSIVVDAPVDTITVTNTAVQNCTNGATNPPLCTTCPIGQTLQNNACGVSTQSTPLTNQEIIGITFSCGTDKTVIVSSTATCSFSLPANKTLPAGFSLAINNGAQGSSNLASNSSILLPFSIQVNAQTSGQTVTVNNVPTGNQVGIYPIFAQYTGSGQINTGETVNVVAQLSAPQATSSPTIDPLSGIAVTPRTGGNSLALLFISAIGIVTSVLGLYKMTRKTITINE